MIAAEPGSPPAAYPPPPQPVKTRFLVGAHNCPLWEADSPHMWDQVLKHPERTPLLGFYDQAIPEVADWETKWAVEHGIDFFVYCWYRAGKGNDVQTRYSSAIDAFLKSRFAADFKFTIMWENQARDATWGISGVTGAADLHTRLFPFWLTNYFEHPSYLKIDNRPVLFIYDARQLARDLGGVGNVAPAFAQMRTAARQAGFAGLYLLGEYRGLDPNELRVRKAMGFDYTFAYVWPVSQPGRAVAQQLDFIRQTRDLAILPQVITVSQGWSGWRDEGPLYKIPPPEFEDLLRQARDLAAAQPTDELGSRLLLLDNWNEWSEGHYLAPHREFGFGYLDAVRKVFSDAPTQHTDLVPEAIGRGPFDQAYQAHRQREQDQQRLLATKVLKPGAADSGLIGWWAFDEELGAAVALDYSGHQRGGLLHSATRAPGRDGNALVCNGGCVVVPSQPALSPTNALSILCWVKTDEPGQDNKWLVNRVKGGGEATGYRLGLMGGRPCFEVPLTSWSHHLQADLPLPASRWVHLAGTFDGRVMRLYVDGTLHGELARPGPIKPNDFSLILGSYEEDHPAGFHGLLDEVKLYHRALSAEEIRAQAGP